MPKTVELYDDKVTILFNESARNRYVVEETGRSPVGVTTVLGVLNKPALLTWPMREAIEFLKLHPNEFEEAAKAYLTKSDKGKSTGTAVHAALESILLGKDYEVPVEAKKAITGFLRWFNEAKPVILATEQVVYSKRYDFAGTYDALLEIDGKVVLVDFKTNNASRSAPKGVYGEHFLQLGAYSLAHHEENPLELIDDLMVIRVGKDGILNTLKASEVGLTRAQCESAFVSVLGAYKFVTPLGKRLGEMA